MGKKLKRKARNKIMKTKPDLTIPFNIDVLGTKDDPCFGKLHDPRAPECQRCGDAEICAIAMSQNNNIARKEIEKTTAFKDMEETKIKPEVVDPKVLRKSIKNRIRKFVRMASITTRQEVIDDVLASYAKDGYTEQRVEALIDRVIHTSDKIISLKQNKLKWKA